MGQENPCEKSLLGSSCRESFGRNQQPSQSSLCVHAGKLSPQFVERRGPAGHSLWQVSAVSVHELPGCGIFSWQGLGNAVRMIQASPLPEWCSRLIGAEQLPLETLAITLVLFLF